MSSNNSSNSDRISILVIAVPAEESVVSVAIGMKHYDQDTCILYKKQRNI
jgi:NADH:ubiquinone oxidoreductase subunit K